jgi:hypothetical protein
MEELKVILRKGNSGSKEVLPSMIVDVGVCASTYHRMRTSHDKFRVAVSNAWPDVRKLDRCLLCLSREAFPTQAVQSWLTFHFMKIYL